MIRVRNLVKSLHRKPMAPTDLIAHINSSAANEQSFYADQCPEIADDKWRDEVMRLCKAEGFAFYRFWGNRGLGFVARPVAWGGFDVTKSGESRFRNRVISIKSEPVNAPAES